MSSRSLLARNRNTRALLALLLLAPSACKDIADPSTDHPIAPNPVTEAGAQQALACGASHGLPIKRPVASIRLYLVPVYPIVIGGREASAYSRAGQIWVPAPLADQPRVWFHEMLHSLYGLPGMTLEGHPRIFADCQILVI